MKRYSCMYLLLILSAFFLIGASCSYAAEPPSEPMLRIESGMHTAMIFKIGLDADNRYLVTGSLDKTVDVWEIATGRLIRTLRPPIGEGNEGMIYAVAISPDGNTVAAGGWTEFAGGSSSAAREGHNIYLFDRSTGRLVQRITGLSNVTRHLSYSKDGKYLAACLGGGNGVRLYSTPDYRLIAEDKDYGAQSEGADFDRHGRLVTSSWDGYIRLYEVGVNGRSPLQLIAKEKGRGGNKPFSVSFSPSSTLDGAKIAVGYDDSVKVDVLSGKDLSYLYSPDTTGVKNGNLASVTWSSDGVALYAGGLFYKDGQRPILKWSDQGRGWYRELKGSSDTIFHLLPLKYGGIAFGAADPVFGIINAADERVVSKGSYIADYRGMLENFLVSYDGFTIQYAYEVGGKSPATFAVKERLLASDLNPQLSQLTPPVTKASGLEITDWKNTPAPKLNGKALKLQQYELSRCLAVSPSGDSFLLGGSWHLRLFDGSGNEKWSVPATGATWSVNISGNGRVAVAAFGDGTIRWFRMTDGKELLTFFPHKDRKRWVMWSPGGYYDASAGADELMGWQVNNGKDREADFFSVSRFRATYYRPDVIARVLEAGSEKEALRWANEESGRKRQDMAVQQMLPPVISIISPAEGSGVSTTEVLIRYSVRTPSGEPVTGIRALVDGRPVSSQRGVRVVSKESGDMELKVPVPERDCEISLLAENRYAASEPATVRVKWKGVRKKEEFVIKPKLYVLSVGVGKYADKSLTLDLAGKDAQDFARAMERQKGDLYRDVVTRVLIDEKASKDEILDALDWLKQETTSKDMAMVFLAGHGINDSSGIYYFLPSNANLERLMRTGVAFSDIKNTVAALAGKTVLFVDTCHSGNVMGKRRGVTDINAVVNELASAENGAVVFASSTGNQYSLEDKAWGNGAFTKALVEGISGKADYTGKGKITINMLDLYLSERVKELTKGQQTPTTTKPQTIADFPIAMRK